MSVRPVSHRVPDRVVISTAERRSTIVDVIRNARRTIALSLFRCTDSGIVAELARATARGVNVEALITSRAKGGKQKLQTLWSALEQAGVSVHAYGDRVVKYHAKYLVADDGPAVVASFNFTRKCFERTCDAIVVTYDPDVVAGLGALIVADRDGGPLPADVPPRLIIGPERARRQFTALIEQAQSSIRLIDAKLTDPDLVWRLNARRAAGLRVEVFGSQWLGDLESHGKMFLIDDRIAVVGGLAIAAISLDFRREVAIIVEEPDAVADVRQLFRGIGALPTAGRLGAVDATDRRGDRPPPRRGAREGS
jgi:phosphatidylserine/phosphatidylglycerophosphate/cardiolipin synthase-like enzyme